MGTRRAIRIGIAGAVAVAAGFSSLPVRSQDAPIVPPEIKRQELDQRRSELEKSRDAEVRIKAEIDVLSRERSRLSSDLVATAGKIRETETSIAASEQRLSDLSSNETDVRKKLEGSRALVAELLAALQRMGYSPPPAILIQPEDALASVRSAMLLGTVLPEIRDQAQELADDLAELGRVRREISEERNRLAGDRADQEAAQTRIRLLIEARQRRQNEREKALVGELDYSQRLGREVKSLEELIARMERDVAAARQAAEKAAAAAAAAPLLEAPPTSSALAALSDPGRLAPALAFSSAKGLLPLPVNGVTLTSFGEDDAYGSTQKGLSISTRSLAQVTAPCDGWVVYAGPFRSYGQVLILNAGGGYHVLLAGMEKISVALGQFVLTGEPVAEMGAVPNQTASMIGGGAAQPVFYVEFRKDGQSIDPGPWWVSSSAEKVRG